MSASAFLAETGFDPSGQGISRGEELDCVSPGMHRGWEDRRFSCRRSRTTAREAIGITLDESDPSDLLLLSAYRNRLFRCPPPVRVEPGEIRRAFGALDRLAGGLAEAGQA